MQGLRRRQAPVDDREHARLHLGCHVPIAHFTVIVWRDQAQNAAESLTKGSRVVVVGRLQ
jgi:hypothetical protein